MFERAIKAESKLRLAIAGPSGSGKTYSALAIGTELGERVAVVDTEHGSASKYADLYSFDVVNFEAPFHPDRFGQAIQAAAAAGYDVLILDSLSHAWNGPGGLLELVDQFAKRMKTTNSFAAWKDATPIQNRLIESIVGAPIHIIATMRSKQEYVLEQVESGGRIKSVPRKVGMAPIQRDSMEYEFDVYLDMTIENDAIVQKTRCPALAGQVITKPGKELALTLREWLHGETVEVETAAADTFPANATRIREGQSKSLHRYGQTLYGDEWPTVGKRMVKDATQGRTESSQQLTQDEARVIINDLLADIKARNEAQREAQPA